MPLTIDRHVPFISRPAILAPPITRSSPWSSKVDDFPVNTSLLTPGADLRGPTLIGLDYRSQVVDETFGNPSDCRLPIAELPIFFFPALANIGNGLKREAFNAERIGTMSVEQTGEPIFSSPTSFASRASVSSSLSGAGANGTNNPFCNTRGFTGSQEIEIAATAACGGCISVSSNNNFRNTL